MTLRRTMQTAAAVGGLAVAMAIALAAPVRAQNETVVVGGPGGGSVSVDLSAIDGGLAPRSGERRLLFPGSRYKPGERIVLHPPGLTPPKLKRPKRKARRAKAPRRKIARPAAKAPAPAQAAAAPSPKQKTAPAPARAAAAPPRRPSAPPKPAPASPPQASTASKSAPTPPPARNPRRVYLPNVPSVAERLHVLDATPTTRPPVETPPTKESAKSEPAKPAPPPEASAKAPPPPMASAEAPAPIEPPAAPPVNAAPRAAVSGPTPADAAPPAPAKSEPQTAALPAIPEPPAPPVTVGEVRTIAFAPGSAALPDTAAPELRATAKALVKDAALRLQLRAYAAGDEKSESRARRLSLSRALSVRSFLIKEGVQPTRIDVRALGNKVPSGPADRVDVSVVSR